MTDGIEVYGTHRITQEIVRHLGKDHVFVFGSNLSGRHGKGAARTALIWGARLGQAVGLQGMTYAIPTKDMNASKALAIDEIRQYVEEFISYAKKNPRLTFLVTEIGCGLAGWSQWEIAPLFSRAKDVPNIALPASFWHILELRDKERP